MNTKDQELEYTTQSNQSNGARSLLTGLIFGSIMGAVTMLFLAPQPGRKTRAEVQKGAEQLRDRTAEVMKERFEQVKNKSQASARRLSRDARRGAGEARAPGEARQVPPVYPRARDVA
jgi:hypothetical protein